MHRGFDVMNSPGDARLRAIWARTNLRHVGFYLSHGVSMATTAWTAPQTRNPARSTWAFLRDEGWTMLPVCVGMQIVPGTAAARRE